MPRPDINLIGKTFGRLTIRELTTQRQCGHVVWRCECTCGSFARVTTGQLKTGNTQSCGCLRQEMVTQSNRKHDAARRGFTKALYRIWLGIKKRCYDKNFEFYKDYGGRGISLYKKWIHSFENFKQYVLTLPKCPPNAGASTVRLKLELDRIENTKDYEPGNLRWATRREQTNNRRSTIFVTYNNENMPLTIAVERYGNVSYQTAHKRIKKGWAVGPALKNPVHRKVLFRFSAAYYDMLQARM